MRQTLRDIAVAELLLALDAEEAAAEAVNELLCGKVASDLPAERRFRKDLVEVCGAVRQEPLELTLHLRLGDRLGKLNDLLLRELADADTEILPPERLHRVGRDDAEAAFAEAKHGAARKRLLCICGAQELKNGLLLCFAGAEYTAMRDPALVQAAARAERSDYRGGRTARVAQQEDRPAEALRQRKAELRVCPDRNVDDHCLRAALCGLTPEVVCGLWGADDLGADHGAELIDECSAFQLLL